MVLKPPAALPQSFLPFENDVKMYGTQTRSSSSGRTARFENDVKMYGTQTFPKIFQAAFTFENDVKMYGTQQQTMTQEYV